MEKRKLYGTIIGVSLFVLFIIGITYAWFTWSSGTTVLSGTSGCFEIEYTNGPEISGNISPSSDYTGGKSTTATMNIKSSCTTQGNATISITTNDTTTIDLSKGAVKYAVYNGSTPVANGTGTITGGTQSLATVELTKTATTYTVYVWIDGTIADNSYVGLAYSGYIHASAVQTES